MIKFIRLKNGYQIAKFGFNILNAKSIYNMSNDLSIKEIKSALISADVYKIKKALDLIQAKSISPKLFLVQLIPIYYLFSSHPFPWNISWGEEYSIGLDIRDQIANIFSNNISIRLKQIIDNNMDLFDSPKEEFSRSTLAYEQYLSLKISEFTFTGEINGIELAYYMMKNKDNLFAEHTLWYNMENEPGTTYLIEEWKKTKDNTILKRFFESGFDINLLDLNLTQEEFILLLTYISSFENIDTIEFLHFSFNRIEYLPKEIGKFQNVKELSLTNNLLKELPQEIGSLRKLEALLISKNELQQLPKNIGHLENLRSLFISENNFQSLPKEIGKLKNLTNLYIDNNSLGSFPNIILHLYNLQTLHISNNKLTHLPEEIGQLKKLNYLSISDNFLESLPNSIFHLPNLQTLHIGNNKLKHLPNEIEQLKSLVKLGLNNSSFESLPTILEKLTHLKELYMYNTSLSNDQINQIKTWLPNCRIYI